MPTLLCADDWDIHEVADRLCEVFHPPLRRGVVTRIVWGSCRALSPMVPRGDLAVQTRRHAQRRLAVLVDRAQARPGRALLRV